MARTAGQYIGGGLMSLDKWETETPSRGSHHASILTAVAARVPASHRSQTSSHPVMARHAPCIPTQLLPTA
ncbi:hypothetical protein MNKW57_28230 [Biformimicrobium ophioploci]|uniref:Uncharacterized protein n=1 Tax=Biformimicrobium ophioploci TaxID=3036711 RepID=A0ABQ6M2F1_9GAMM|nr:hypothetical protein MNKW57_28230 [Microbulbifer sp. NKW57]